MSRMCRKICEERNVMKSCSPNDELCTFYRNKVSRMEDKFAELWEMLERLGVTCKESESLHSELQSRTSEVNKLQLAISDLQVFLFREREENLKLAAENDELRIQDYENNKAIRILLKLCGLNRGQLTELMSTKNERQHASSCSNRSEGKENAEPTKATLMLEVKSLKTQLENLRTLFRNEVDVLLKDREVVAEEHGVETKRLNNHLSILANNLKQMQTNFKEVMHRVLKFEEMDTRERGKISMERWSDGPLSRDDYSSATLNAGGSSRSLKSCGTKILKSRLNDQEKLCSAYQQQCKQLEVEMKRWKERAENAEKAFKEKVQSLTSDLSVMRNRYDDLDRRRILEGEGFRTDIKLLRDRLKELDRQIIKIKSDGGLAQFALNEDLKASTQVAFKRAQQFEKEVAALKLKFMALTRDCGQ